MRSSNEGIENTSITKNSLEEKWEAFSNNIPGYIENAGLLIEHHDQLINQHINLLLQEHLPCFQANKALINNLLNILKGLHTFQKKFNVEEQLKRPETARIIAELHIYKTVVLEQILKLRTALASKYYYAVNFNKEHAKKLSYLQLAYETLKVAEDMKTENSSLKNICPENDDLLNQIAAEYNYLARKKVYPADKKNSLAIEASYAKTAEEACNKYQQAIACLDTGNENYHQLKFRIIILQSNRYEAEYAKYSKKNNVLLQKNQRTLCNLWIAAAEIKLSCPPLVLTNNMAEMLCRKLHGAAKNLFGTGMIASGHDMAVACFADAKEYQTWADKLANNLNLDCPDFHELAANIQKWADRFQQAKEIIHQCNIQKEQEKQQLVKAIQEYEEKFEETLKTLEKLDQKDHRPRPQKKSVSTIIFNNTNSSSEEEMKPAENNDICSTPIVYNPERAVIYDSIFTSDSFRLEAIKLLKQKNVSAAIDALEKSVHHLKLAANDIQCNKNHCDLSDLKKWTCILTEDTEALLKKNLESHKKAALQLEESREKAKHYIIEKYGSKAWYKNIDETSLSPNAKRQIEFKQRIIRLSEIQNDIVSLKECLSSQQIENVTNYAEHAFFKVLKVEEKITRERSDSMNTNSEKIRRPGDSS
jgi:hypothetical protein